MASAKQKPRLPLNKILPMALIIVAGIVAVAPAVAYGGFIVNTDTVTFSETTGSLTATTPQSNVASMNVYQYMLSKASGPVLTVDKTTTGANIAKITMVLNLAPPSGQSTSITTANIQGSIGTRNHTIILGPGEGVRGSGVYSLTITISVQITTPSGALLETTSMTIIHSFTVP